MAVEVIGESEDAESVAYSRRVGARLRSIRRQKKLSLQEVELGSTQEFKASVLGAYERGERAVSLPRLRRLANFYQVPTEQLLPREETAVVDVDTATQHKKIVIDLTKLAQMKSPPFELLARFLSMIQVQRGDFNGKVLTVRADDARAVAAMLDVCLDEVPEHLQTLGLSFDAGASH